MAMEKSTIRIPFTGYDIFAYLTPSIIFFSLIIFFEYKLSLSANKIVVPFYSFFSKIMELFYQEKESWALTIILLLSMLCIAYATGHIIASISSLLIDRILIYKGYGYPYEMLFFPKIEKTDNPLSGPYYRGAYFWINIILFLFFFYKINFIIKNSIISLLGLNWLSLLLLAGFIITLLLKIYYSNNYFEKKNSKGFKLFNKFLLICFSFIYDIFSNILSKYINTKRAFNKEFIDEYENHFKRIFGLEAKKADTNNFWLSYIYVSENSVSLNTSIMNWLNLYSFARNLSASFYLAFLYVGATFIFQIEKIPLELVKTGRMLFVGSFFLSVIMLIRYYYLYASYFTKFIFRSFVYISRSKSK